VTPLSGAAVTEYGQAAMQLVYKQMLAFTFDNGWNSSLMRTHADSVKAADFSAMLDAMTTQCAATFSAAFAKIEKHDKVAIRTMEGAVFFGIQGPHGIRPTQTTGLVTNRKYSQVTLGIDRLRGVDLVSLGFTAKADIHMQDAAGKPYTLPTTRVVRYLLAPNSGKDKVARPFLISAWKNTMTAAHIKSVQ
jgi:hypothetical protein